MILCEKSATFRDHALERFPFFVNRGDSLRTANKILWPSPSGGGCDGVFERSASSSDPGSRGRRGCAGGCKTICHWGFYGDPLDQALAGDRQLRSQVQQGSEPITFEEARGMAA